MELLNIFLGVAVLIPALIIAYGFRQRRKAAQRTAMRCLSLSDNPTVRASRDVH